jgi:membrane protein
MLLVRYTPLTEEMVLTAVNNMAPKPFIPAISRMVNDIYSNVNATAFFLAIIAVLWAAGKGFVSLIDGLNAVFDIDEHRNWIRIRLYAILYTVIFLIIIVTCLVIYVLGYRIKDILMDRAPFVHRVFEIILQFRALIVTLLLTVLFTFLYVAIPNRHTKIKRQIPGALFAAVGWMGFSFVFSLYIKYSSKLSLIYGSLTTLVCVILWLYVCMYIFLVGAEVNLYYEQWNAGSSIEKATDITHTHQ